VVRDYVPSTQNGVNDYALYDLGEYSINELKIWHYNATAQIPRENNGVPASGGRPDVRLFVNRRHGVHEAEQEENTRFCLHDTQPETG
jgi:hypothetical protein